MNGLTIPSASILAINLGKYNSMCCFYNPDGAHQFQTVPTDRDYLRSFLQAQQVDRVVFEACGPSGWLTDLCRELGLETMVCSTNEEAWHWKNVKRKTDKDDALKLAQMSMLGSLKPVHIPSPEVRELRGLVKYRKSMNQRINRLKNSIRSLFANHGIPIDAGKRAWCSGRSRLDSYRKPIHECSSNELWQGQLDTDLAQLDYITKQLKVIEKRLEELAKSNPHVQRLTTIPGVGRKTAETIVAMIDDPHRFKSARAVSVYAGLVPKQYQSGQTDRHGRITNRGSRLLRTMLVECAWISTRYNRWAKQTYQRIHGNQVTRRKKAGVAVARRLLVIAWAMMRDETVWNPHRLLPSEQADDATIKVTQQPNLAAGELRHLPKHLRDALLDEPPPVDSESRTEECHGAPAST